MRELYMTLPPTDCERIRVPALEGVRQLILGSVYSNCGEQDKAEVAYGLAMKADDGQDTHAAAFAAYELGLLLCRKQEVRADLFVAAIDVFVLPSVNPTFNFFAYARRLGPKAVAIYCWLATVTDTTTSRADSTSASTLP